MLAAAVCLLHLHRQQPKYATRPAHTLDMTSYEVSTLTAQSCSGTLRTVARSTSLHTPFLPGCTRSSIVLVLRLQPLSPHTLNRCCRRGFISELYSVVADCITVNWLTG